MSNESIIYLVAACSGVFGLAAYVGLILVPAWSAYSRVWERLAATFLTLYVLAGFLILGVAGGDVDEPVDVEVAQHRSRRALAPVVALPDAAALEADHLEAARA